MITSKRYILILLLSLLWGVGGPAFGQGYSSVIEYPDPQSWSRCLELHPDGGSVIASAIECPNSGDLNQIILFKTNVTGDLEYYKTFAFCDSASADIQHDGPLLAIDSSFYLFWFPLDTNNLIHLTKFDLELNEVFTQSYTTDGIMIASNIVQISSNRLVLEYGEYRADEMGISRFIKVDLNGNEINRGQVSFPHMRYKSRGKQFTSSANLTERGTILLSFATAESSFAHNHYILEVDTFFNVVTDYHYQNLEDFDTQHCGYSGGIVQSSVPIEDEKFVVVNCRDTIEFAWPPVMLTSYHPRITLYATSGMKLWDTTFLSYSGYTVNQMDIDNKGNIYCVGQVGKSDKSNEIAGVFFLKLTSSGKPIWLRRIFPDHTQFGDSNDMLNIEIMSDGGVLASGYIDMNDELGSLNTWLIRLDSNGCITPGCTDEDILLSTAGDSGPWRSLDQVPLLVYPNPTYGKVHFQTNFIPETEDVVIWYDLMGRAVQTNALLPKKVQILAPPFHKGLFLLTLYRGVTPVHTTRVMLK